MQRLLCLSLMLAASTVSASNNLGFVSEPGDWVGGGETRDYDDQNSTFRFSASADKSTVQVSLDTLDGTEWWYLTLDAPNGQPLTVGSYTEASRYPFNSTTTNGLSFSGTGRGCNTLSGEVEISGIGYAPDGTLDYLDATWIQYCETTMPPLHGYVLIDNRPVTPPMTVNLAIAPEGTWLPGNNARVTGEVACSPDSSAEITGIVTQGHYQMPFSITAPCTSSPSGWQVMLAGIKKGNVVIDATATVYRPETPSEIAETVVSQTVRVQR